MLELCDALKTRGILKEEDAAGALLRTEYKVEQDVRYEENDDFITHAPFEETTRAMLENWQARLALRASLHTLRQKQGEWLMQGMHGISPLEAERVLALYKGTHDDDRAT